MTIVGRSAFFAGWRLDIGVSNTMICRLEDIGCKDRDLFGGKAAMLGELLQHGYPVPTGFALSANLLQEALERAGVLGDLKHLVHRIGRLSSDHSEFRQFGNDVRTLIGSLALPSDLVQSIMLQLTAVVSGFPSSAVAVRSSATSEDQASASSAGQFSTFLNIRTTAHLQKAILECWSSFYSDRSIRYRKRQGIELWPPLMGVVVQYQLIPDSAGIVFTVHPQRGPDWLVAEASWGLGEPIVGGRVTPDTYEVNRYTLEYEARHGSKKTKQIIVGHELEEVETDESERTSLCLDEEAVYQLAKLCLQIEADLGQPQDIEFAVSNNSIYILQARPITTLNGPAGR